MVEDIGGEAGVIQTKQRDCCLDFTRLHGKRCSGRRTRMGLIPPIRSLDQDSKALVPDGLECHNIANTVVSLARETCDPSNAAERRRQGQTSFKAKRQSLYSNVQ